MFPGIIIHFSKVLNTITFLVEAQRADMLNSLLSDDTLLLPFPIDKMFLYSHETFAECFESYRYIFKTSILNFTILQKLCLDMF
jgi:hypothetical protein